MMMYFLLYHDALKCINHGRKIARMHHPEEQWFHNFVQLFGLCDL